MLLDISPDGLILLRISLTLSICTALGLYLVLRSLNVHRVEQEATSFSDLYLDTKGEPLTNPEGMVELSKGGVILLTTWFTILNLTAFILAVTYFVQNEGTLYRDFTIEYSTHWEAGYTATLTYIAYLLSAFLPLAQVPYLRDLYYQHYEYYRKARKKRDERVQFKAKLAQTTRQHNGWF